MHSGHLSRLLIIKFKTVTNSHATTAAAAYASHSCFFVSNP